MPLKPLTDLSAADWFVQADADVWTKICLGPPGYEAYARVSFLPDDDDAYHCDRETMAIALDALAPHTTTPEQIFVGIWHGWGSWDEPSRLARHRPRLSVSDHRGEIRDYVLLEGPLDGALTRESLGLDPAHGGAPTPHLLWPADRAWFIASDVDPDWFGISGPQAVIDELMAVDGLDIAPSTYDADEWDAT